MTVLPNFVPTPSPPSKGPRISNRPFFVYVGRLEKLKGLQDLIEVFRGYRRADLLVVGDGTYAKTLIRQADGLPHVRFIGLSTSVQGGLTTTGKPSPFWCPHCAMRYFR